MKISTALEEGRLNLRLCGELDHHAAKSAVLRIGREIDAGMPRDCVMDLSGLSFMDSSGIGVILGTYKRMQEIGGRLRVVEVKKQPMKVLNASGVCRIVEIKEAGKEAYI